MKKEIVINATSSEIRVAITEDDRLAEIFLEVPDKERHVGSIYLGRVERVVQGMNAAFIDIGEPQDAFLHFSDVGSALDEFKDLLDERDEDDEDDQDAADEKAAPRKNGKAVPPGDKKSGGDARKKDSNRHDRRGREPHDTESTGERTDEVAHGTQQSGHAEPLDKSARRSGKPEPGRDGRRGDERRTDERRSDGRRTGDADDAEGSRRPDTAPDGRRPAGRDMRVGESRRHDEHEEPDETDGELIEGADPTQTGGEDGSEEPKRRKRKRGRRGGRGRNRRRDSETPAEGSHEEPEGEEREGEADGDDDAAARRQPAAEGGRGDNDRGRGHRNEPPRHERADAGDDDDDDREQDDDDDREDGAGHADGDDDRQDNSEQGREGRRRRRGRRGGRNRRKRGGENERQDGTQQIATDAPQQQAAGSGRSGEERRTDDRRHPSDRDQRNDSGRRHEGGARDGARSSGPDREGRPAPESRPHSDERHSTPRREVADRGHESAESRGTERAEHRTQETSRTGGERREHDRTETPQGAEAEQIPARAPHRGRQAAESPEGDAAAPKKRGGSRRKEAPVPGESGPAADEAGAGKESAPKKTASRSAKKAAAPRAKRGRAGDDDVKGSTVDAKLPTFQTKRSGEVTIALEKGQDVIVQVTRESYASKGVRVTTKVSLPGRFLVLLPLDPAIGISRKVQNMKERRRLRRIAKSILPEGHGCIIRTVAQDKDEEVIKQDLMKLIETWREIEQKLKVNEKPTLLYKDQSIANTVMRDLFTPDTNRVVIDNKALYKEIRDYVEWAAPGLADKVELYTGSRPIFDEFNIEREIQKIADRRVYIPSGGYVILDQTEAMMVIDVNSGRYAGKKDQELNSLRTNLESAREIARQIRLRDIGGLLVIDFIDLYDEKNRKKVYDELKKEMRRDRAKSVVLPMTQFGLVQMTRQRIRQQVVQTMSEPCPICSGSGLVQSKSTVARNIERWLQRFKEGSREFRLTLTANPMIINYLTEGEMSRLTRMMLKYFVRIKVVPDESLPVSDFRFFSTRLQADITEKFAEDPNARKKEEKARKLEAKKEEARKEEERREASGREGDERGEAREKRGHGDRKERGERSLRDERNGHEQRDNRKDRAPQTGTAREGERRDTERRDRNKRDGERSGGHEPNAHGERGDRQKGQHRHGEPPQKVERRADERRGDERRNESRRDEGRGDDRRSDGRRHDEHRGEKRTHDDAHAGERRTDEQRRTDERRGDGRRGSEPRAAEPRGAGPRSDEPRGERRGDERRGGERRSDERRSGQHHGDARRAGGPNAGERREDAARNDQRDSRRPEGRPEERRNEGRRPERRHEGQETAAHGADQPAARGDGGPRRTPERPERSVPAVEPAQTEQAAAPATRKSTRRTPAPRKGSHEAQQVLPLIAPAHDGTAAAASDEQAPATRAPRKGRTASTASAGRTKPMPAEGAAVEPQAEPAPRPKRQPRRTAAPEGTAPEPAAGGEAEPKTRKARAPRRSKPSGDGAGSE
ncbi:MAG: Rne/Rng family ribonuclease [Bacteroidetes bacterium]|nr:Rne/Rng family ribonuclease [Bacteroidota bacterium]